MGINAKEQRVGPQLLQHKLRPSPGLRPSPVSYGPPQILMSVQLALYKNEHTEKHLRYKIDEVNIS